MSLAGCVCVACRFIAYLRQLGFAMPGFHCSLPRVASRQLCTIVLKNGPGPNLREMTGGRKAQWIWSCSADTPQLFPGGVGAVSSSAWLADVAVAAWAPLAEQGGMRMWGMMSAVRNSCWRSARSHPPSSRLGQAVVCSLCCFFSGAQFLCTFPRPAPCIQSRILLSDAIALCTTLLIHQDVFTQLFAASNACSSSSFRLLFLFSQMHYCWRGSESTYIFLYGQVCFIRSGSSQRAVGSDTWAQQPQA